MSRPRRCCRYCSTFSSLVRMCSRRSSRLVLPPTAFRRPLPRSNITPDGWRSKAGFPKQSRRSWSGADTKSCVGPTGSGRLAPSAQSSPTAAVACSKPAPTRAAPPTPSAGSTSAVSFGLGLECRSHRLCHFEELVSHLLIGDGIVEPDELDGFRTLQLLAPLLVLGAEVGVVLL